MSVAVGLFAVSQSVVGNVDVDDDVERRGLFRCRCCCLLLLLLMMVMMLLVLMLMLTILMLRPHGIAARSGRINRIPSALGYDHDHSVSVSISVCIFPECSLTCVPFVSVSQSLPCPVISWLALLCSAVGETAEQQRFGLQE